MPIDDEAATNGLLEFVELSRAPCDTALMSHWPGRFRLVYSDELRNWYRARISKNLAEPEAIDAALREAEAEAAGAEIWISDDHVLSSRAGDREFYSASLEVSGSVAHFTKPPDVPVELELTNEGILAKEPNKPAMRFIRETAPVGQGSGTGFAK